MGFSGPDGRSRIVAVNPQQPRACALGAGRPQPGNRAGLSADTSGFIGSEIALLLSGVSDGLGDEVGLDAGLDGLRLDASTIF